MGTVDVPRDLERLGDGVKRAKTFGDDPKAPGLADRRATILDDRNETGHRAGTFDVPAHGCEATSGGAEARNTRPKTIPGRATSAA